MTNDTQNKGGRPVLLEPRNITFATKLNASEAAKVNRMVALSGMKRSEAIRLLLTQSELPKAVYRGVSQDGIEIYRGMGNIQNNLNQIAKALNQIALGYQHPQAKKVLEAASRHSQIIAQQVAQLRHEIIVSDGA